MAKIMDARRVLILYATMTRNTQQIAEWFKETFEAYGWECTFVRIAANTKWEELQDKLYFDDYDLICLGSPIVGGNVLKPLVNVLSFGGGGSLEKEVQQNLDQKKADAAAPPAGMRVEWRRSHAPSPGMPNHEGPRPYGIVFTTYGGGFFGPDEATASLEQMKLYLKLYNVDMIGRFSCAGKETGPAGYPLGEKPKKDFIPGKKLEGPDADVCDAVMYKMGDGSLVPGSYFFHYDCDSKPGPREEAKAKAFIADIVECYFMTYDGVPNPPLSEFTSLS